jgi:hypothetical protein
VKEVKDAEMVKTSPIQTTSCNPPLRRSIEDFLDLQCNPALAASECSSCGACMVHLDTMFYLLGGAQAWTIPLSLCPQCDLKGGSSMSGGQKLSSLSSSE